MSGRSLIADAGRGGGAVDRTRIDRVLDLAYDVGPKEMVTHLTVATSAGVVARRRILGIDLPFDDGSIDRVVCAEGLQLLSERGRALAEIRRVLVRDGEVSVSVPGAIERNSPFAELATSLERRAGVLGAAAVRWLFCMPDPDDLRGVLAAAAFEDIRIDVVRTTSRRAHTPVTGGDPDGSLITSETIIGRARRS